MDPFGRNFSQNYYPEWFDKAGQRLAGPFHAICDGIHGDQAWIHDTFGLLRTMAALSMAALPADVSFQCEFKDRGTLAGNIFALIVQPWVSQIRVRTRRWCTQPMGLGLAIGTRCLFDFVVHWV